MIASENENELGLDNVAGIRKTNPVAGKGRNQGGGRRAGNMSREAVQSSRSGFPGCPARRERRRRSIWIISRRGEKCALRRLRRRISREKTVGKTLCVHN